jgi:hypothetical protein
MPNTNNILLCPEELYRLNYEEYGADHWSDIDGFVKIFMLEDKRISNMFSITKMKK